MSGKHNLDQGPAAGTRFSLGNAAQTYQDRYWKDREFETVAALGALAAEAGIALPTLAVAWTLLHPAITSPIIGASRPDQLDATLAAVDVSLDVDLVARLDALTRVYRQGDVAR